MLIPCLTTSERRRNAFSGGFVAVYFLFGLCLGLPLGQVQAQAQTGTNNQVVLYTTGFEAGEGYDSRFTLIGQNGWVGAGSGGNGLVPDFFPGYGQQAFVGFTAENTNDTLNVWRPVNFLPPTNVPVKVQFSVLMAIYDSTNQYYDDFRWSVYNTTNAISTNATRLFTLDFDNSGLLISYALDDSAGFVSTGIRFTNATMYSLTIDMDFSSNLWSATLNGRPLAGPLPLTTTGARLNLGDIDAVWAIRTPGFPGNNYMVFDDYRIVEITRPPPPPPSFFLTPVARLPGGQFLLTLTGQSNRAYAIEASTNLVNWLALKTNNTATDGTFDFMDSTASALDHRFYRARQIEP